MTETEKLVTVVVTPRERFSTTPETLRSLFETIDREVPVIVVDGGAPAAVLHQIENMRQKRPFELITSPHIVLPSEARNIGYRATSSKYVAFADNDVIFEQRWLDEMIGAAERHKADVVTPLICIGPPVGEMIHHAGGAFNAWQNQHGIVVNEINHLMDQPIADLVAGDIPIDTEVCEFHCVLIRRDLIDRMGGFAEGLITREHLDFSYRNALMGGRMVFAPEALVTYMRQDMFSADDLPYHLYRWSDRMTKRSISNFEKTWNVVLPKRHLRVDWIGRHRRRAIAESYPRIHALLGQRLFDGVFSSWLEKSTFRKEERRRKNRTGNQPRPLDPRKVGELIAKVLERSPDPEPLASQHQNKK